MSDGSEVKDRKAIIKTFLNTLRFGTVTDPDFSEKTIEDTKIFTEQEIWNHITGKKKLTDEELEQIKRSAKYNNFLL